MFDAILELRRRRLSGLPQVTGNIQTPQIGPDIEAPPPQQPMQMMSLPTEQGTEPNINMLGQLGGQRAMQLLIKRMKPKEAKSDAMESLPILKSLFRRSAPTS